MENALAIAILAIMFTFIGIPLLGKASTNPLTQHYHGYVDFFINGCRILIYISLALLGFYALIWSLSTLGA